MIGVFISPWRFNGIDDDLLKYGLYFIVVIMLPGILNQVICCIPEASADFVCKMEDVLKVYKRPYDEKCPVVCMDESSKQLTKETRAPIPAEPGQPEKYDTEYERNGTNNIFLACEPLAGKK